MQLSHFPARRSAALSRLSEFLSEVPHYASRRNFVDDNNSSVSQLSPYIRRRVLLEQEVVDQTLARYPFPKVEKFVQEVVWRTYWKGWLQSRPWVWESYLADLERLGGVDADSANDFDRDLLQRALTGETPLEYFNAWVHELTTTGYLHNHVRMWFASIWIFTLGLPWQLGARFFLEQLLDGDPAANTLSWRWVAGLQTVGKHYVATPSNIRRYTEDRWRPASHELSANPSALSAESFSARPPLPFAAATTGSLALQECTVLLHDEDLSIETGELPIRACAQVIALTPSFSWRVHRPSRSLQQFIHGLFDDAVSRVAHESSHPVRRVANATEIVSTGSRALLCYRPLVGFLDPQLEALRQQLAEHGIPLHFVDRAHDAQLFPYALRGFFPYWERVSKTIASRSNR